MSAREKIAQDILDCSAGYRFEETLLAHSDALGSLVGGVCCTSDMTQDEAKKVIDKIAEGAKKHIVQHWGTIEVRPKN